MARTCRLVRVHNACFIARQRLQQKRFTVAMKVDSKAFVTNALCISLVSLVENSRLLVKSHPVPQHNIASTIATKHKALPQISWTLAQPKLYLMLSWTECNRGSRAAGRLFALTFVLIFLIRDVVITITVGWMTPQLRSKGTSCYKCQK